MTYDELISGAYMYICNEIIKPFKIELIKQLVVQTK